MRAEPRKARARAGRAGRVPHQEPDVHSYSVWPPVAAVELDEDEDEDDVVPP